MAKNNEFLVEVYISSVKRPHIFENMSSTNICASHEYEARYSSCPNCIKGYAICSICDGDGSCIGDGCDRGLAHCQTKGCKYGYIYQTHYCIKCGNAKYIK